MTKKMTKRIIFLDIDGVLNSTRSALAFKGHSGGEHLDPIACLLLKQLCEKTDSSIVITSSWRLMYHLHEIIEYINHACPWDKWNNVIFSVTPDGDDDEDSEIRGDEVESWLESAGEQYDHANYVIFDDCEEFYKYQPFIEIDDTYGLSHQHFEEAKKILEK